MISNTEVTRKKTTRGAILTTLYNSQAAPMPVNTLELVLMQGNPAISGEMVPAINYLCDRGYIKAVDGGESEINPMRGMLVRITDRGQDVVEGTTKDQGILFARGE